MKATHFHWYTMQSKGLGRVRSYGKRIVSNMWSNVVGRCRLTLSNPR